MNLVLKGLVKLATDFVENNDFRNDLLLSFLSNEEVQKHNQRLGERLLASLKR